MTQPRSRDHQRSLVTDLIADRSVDNFRRLYAAHADSCWRFAVRLTGDHDRAADIVQEAWCRVVERLSTFEHRSQPRTWILGFVANCAREDRRTYRRDQHRINPREGTGSENPFDQAAEPLTDQVRTRSWHRLDLSRALSQLSRRSREVVILHDIEGYTHAEIASILAIEVGTSKSQLSRARKRLRQLLQGAQSNEQSSRR